MMKNRIMVLISVTWLSIIQDYHLIIHAFTGTLQQVNNIIFGVLGTISICKQRGECQISVEFVFFFLRRNF